MNWENFINLLKMVIFNKINIILHIYKFKKVYYGYSNSKIKLW